MNLIEYLNSYNGRLLVNGVDVSTLTLDHTQTHAVITLVPKTVPTAVSGGANRVQTVDNGNVYRFTVKQYMTKPSTPDFDLMAKWNNDIPMPLCTMVGTVVKETKGMVYLDLHGDTDGKPVQYCMKCGRQITNPVSRYFGLGPECGGHGYTNPFTSEEALHSAVDAYRKEVLQKMTWTGWVPKSAIKEMVSVT